MSEPKKQKTPAEGLYHSVFGWMLPCFYFLRHQRTSWPVRYRPTRRTSPVWAMDAWTERAEGRWWLPVGEQLEKKPPRLLWWPLGTPRSCEGDVEHGSPELKGYKNVLMRCEISDGCVSRSAHLEGTVDA